MDDLIPSIGMVISNDKGYKWVISAVMITGQSISEVKDSVNDRKIKGKWTVKLEAINHFMSVKEGSYLYVE